ncbi:MAG: hypothetical protein M3256_16110 [Actinomycetota bacterium]|nr:hypothetical protein [Actinomycetota bacterium]
MVRTFPRKLSFAVLAALGLVATACAPRPPQLAGDGPTAAHGTLPAGPGAYIGAFVAPNGSGQGAEKSSVEAEERYLGRKLDIAHWFYPWSGVFPTWRESYDIANGRIPMISWGGTDTRSIVNGSQDGLIRARADGVRNLGRPVLMRWFWEMDGNTNASKANNPALFKAAWERIVSLFRSRGANNAAFVWCPNAWGVDTGRAQQWYPNPSTVDWICGDGYNWYPRKPGSQWISFEATFHDWYAWASTKGKPLMLGELGAQEDPGSPGRKAQWIRDMATVLQTRMPKVRAVVYFDHRTNSYSDPGIVYDWSLTSSSSAHATWRSVGLSRYFRPAHR